MYNDEGDDAGRAVWESAVEDMVSVQSRPRARGTKGYRCPTSDSWTPGSEIWGAPVAGGQTPSVASFLGLVEARIGFEMGWGQRRREASLLPDSLGPVSFSNEAG